MATSETTNTPIEHADRLFIGGAWVEASTGSKIRVIDSATQELFFEVAEAQGPDITRAVTAARVAFDDGPWPRLSHAARAAVLRALGAAIEERSELLGQLWPRESGVLFAAAQRAGAGAAATMNAYADLADTYVFEEEVTPGGGGKRALVIHEPVGVVGAIIPWNGPLTLACHKIGPALLAGCTVVLKSSPEAPGEGYVIAAAAEQVGLPPGVLNVVTADRQASEHLVRDPRVDKITFTGSTAAGRRIASLCGERIARCSLELGGKSAAVVLDDADIAQVAEVVATQEVFLTGQACNSLTRVVVTRDRHDEMVEALAGIFSQLRVGDPFDTHSQMGPLSSDRQRDRVEGYIAKGITEGARLATGGGRPGHLDRGWFVEPTVFGHVDNSATIAQEEIFGPVLSVIPADDEEDAIRIANDTIYGLNASVFTDDEHRALEVARRIRSGTVGHNAKRGDLSIAFGGYKQSGIGREGSSREGLYEYLETKVVVLGGD
jgi:aldehyde dehydrogenase (NAD+)